MQKNKCKKKTEMSKQCCMCCNKCAFSWKDWAIVVGTVVLLVLFAVGVAVCVTELI